MGVGLCFIYFFWLVSLRLSCSVICIFLTHIVVSEKKNMTFRLSIKFCIYIVVIRLFHFLTIFARERAASTMGDSY